MHCSCDLQLPIVASSMVSLYFLELTDVLQPAQVGFRCHDRSLSMPYVESGEELIPLLMLLSLAFAGPAASVSIIDCYRYKMVHQILVLNVTILGKFSGINVLILGFLKLAWLTLRLHRQGRSSCFYVLYCTLSETRDSLIIWIINGQIC